MSAYKGFCGTPWAAIHALVHDLLQAELRELQPVLEQTAKDVEVMMVQITADKQEADVTQKRVAKQEQEADEQAAKVRAAVAASVGQLWQQACGSCRSKYAAALSSAYHVRASAVL